jgi:hypothetical protein
MNGGEIGETPEPESRTGCYSSVLDNNGQTGGAMVEFPRYHMSYYGYPSPYGGGVAWSSVWASEGCYDTIRNLLGYRFQLDSISHSSSANKGETVKVSVNLHDVGWARIFSARKLVVTLVNRSTGESIVGTAGDARLLPSQSTQSSTVNVNVNIPSTATAGTYDVYLSMPDIYSTTKDNPYYAVRFANADLGNQSWDGNLARFKTGTSVTVSNSVTVAPGPTPVPTPTGGVEWTGVTAGMWTEINTQRVAFGDTNDCQARVSAIPTSGGITLNPGDNIISALASNNIVFLNGGTYHITSRIYIPDGKKLIGVAGQTVILDGSGIDYPVLPGNNVVLANVRIENAQGDGVLFFNQGAGDGSAHDSLVYQVLSDRSGYDNMNGDNSSGIRLVQNASHNCIVSVEASNTWNEIGGSNYHGGNADGLDSSFGAYDNTFIDVHSHNNGDDGVDMWHGGVAFWYFSVSHDNGKVPGKDNQGNGNGVKLGPSANGVCGAGVTHHLYKVSAYNNVTRGIDINGNTNPADLVQVTSTNNGDADWLVWVPSPPTCP